MNTKIDNGRKEAQESQKGPRITRMNTKGNEGLTKGNQIVLKVRYCVNSALGLSYTMRNQ